MDRTPQTVQRQPPPDGINDLRAGGILSRTLPGYQERPAQIAMVTLVVRSLHEGVPAVIEAGTGVGKSLSYILPVVRSGKVAVISTANKALQEQLFYKDIPFVQKHIAPFEAALVKGISNYACLDRMEKERAETQFYVQDPAFTRLAELVDDEASIFNGDFETLDFPFPAQLKSRINGDSDQCAWRSCSYFQDCYIRKMRAQAAQAQIIVVNHTLLLLDAAIDGNLLPEHAITIIDEAHSLEEEATRAFTVTVSANQVYALLALKKVRAHSQPELQDAVAKQTVRLFQALKQRFPDVGNVTRLTVTTAVEEGLRLASLIEELAEDLRRKRPGMMTEQEEVLYNKLVTRTQNLAINVRLVFEVKSRQSFVYYLERVQAGREVRIEMSAAPLSVAPFLKERLFAKGTVICTSATLATTGPHPAQPRATGSPLAFFCRRVGLSHPATIECILPLVFDYQRNALLYLPRTLPEPTYGKGQAAQDYQQAIGQEMLRLVLASRGRAFLLFSSKRMLEAVYDQIVLDIPYPVLRQGELPRAELTRQFRSPGGAVLFGLKSFWEGVDIAGEALSLVVIDKLPFDPPDDPVHEARVARMKAAGENWFGTYVLPQTVLRLKQGVGRLIRTHEDRGVMAILDVRMHTKGYGAQIRGALPPARPTSDLRDVECFFAAND